MRRGESAKSFVSCERTFPLGKEEFVMLTPRTSGKHSRQNQRRSVAAPNSRYEWQNTTDNTTESPGLSDPGGFMERVHSRPRMNRSSEPRKKRNTRKRFSAHRQLPTDGSWIAAICCGTCLEPMNAQHPTPNVELRSSAFDVRGWTFSERLKERCTGSTVPSPRA